MKRILYARNNKGKILEWSVDILQNGFQVDIKIAYGEVEGEKTITWRRNIKGKNIGKANETSPYEQAEKGIESLINKHKDKGYVELNFPNSMMNSFQLRKYLEDNVPKYRTDASGFPKPMKCQQYYRNKKDWTDPTGKIWDNRKYYYLQNPHVEKEDKAIIINFPAMAQPKINGVRATISLDNGKVLIRSKEGKLYSIPHISNYLQERKQCFTRLTDNDILDGELYIHGEALQDIGSAVDKTNLNTSRIVFVAFDLAVEGYTNLERWQSLKAIVNNDLASLNSPIELIKTYQVRNDVGVQELTDRFIAQGYEGSIIRDMNATYNFGGRPMTIVKLKRTISEEFKIINVVPQEKDPNKGNFVCITPNGETFEVNPRGTEEYKIQILNSPTSYIGKNLTCVFYEYTNKNIPFHILDNIVRDYE